MDLILLIIVLVVVGFLVWVLTTQIPMPPIWSTTIQVLALVIVVLYVLARFLRLPNFLH